MLVGKRETAAGKIHEKIFSLMLEFSRYFYFIYFRELVGISFTRSFHRFLVGKFFFKQWKYFFFE
jgi:hypothetical protein